MFIIAKSIGRCTLLTRRAVMCSVLSDRNVQSTTRPRYTIIIRYGDNDRAEVCVCNTPALYLFCINTIIMRFRWRPRRMHALWKSLLKFEQSDCSRFLHRLFQLEPRRFAGEGDVAATLVRRLRQRGVVYNRHGGARRRGRHPPQPIAASAAVENVWK